MSGIGLLSSIGRVVQSLKALKYVVRLPHSVRRLGSLDLGDNKVPFESWLWAVYFVVPTIFLPTKANFYNFSKFRA